jgi:hypothetical protein
MIRALILVALITICVCFLLRDRPTPVKAAKVVTYCVIDEHFAAKDELGRWHRFWGKGYGPCSRLDRYENI